MKSAGLVILRRSLLAAASTASMMAGGAAFAQSGPSASIPTATLDIVANHEVPLGPPSALPGINAPGNGSVYSNSPQVLDPAGSINGVGQQIAFIQTGPASAGLSLCSGTLINARTVITAAHCVYNNAAHRYGSNTGSGGGVNGNFGAGGALLTSQGIPLSFGFESLNRNCFNASGLPFTCPAGQKGPYETWRDANFQTVTSRHIYNANQVWYGTGAQPVALGGGGEFANQDIALVTLDTHVKDIPTWTLLFSPLDGPTHAIVTGYGGAGVGLSGIGNLAGIDYRRRSAENMIDALMTNNDWVDSPAIDPGNTAYAAHQHAIYWLDFDDPNHDPDNLPANFFTNTAPPGGRNNGYYDFNGLGGVTLANEGATAGGDSGGPLIVDQRFDKPVVAGVLTGSWSFNGGISTYGQFNVYPPLFQFWEDIVQNNPYVYASAKAGIGDWFDPNHWVQDMDPNYGIIGPDGELLNGVPDSHQGGADGAVDKFGTLCFLGSFCSTFDGPGAPAGTGTPIVTAGGPGSTNFVPNNVEPVNSANPALFKKARYYDVTLSRPGVTTLNQAATIDMMTVDNPLAVLAIGATGTLNTWADFTQGSGWTRIDGTLNTNEMLVVSGLLSGQGTINADYLTVVGGVVAPAGAAIGTLNVNADTILASASGLLIDVTRGSADKLAVGGALVLSDGNLVMNKVGAAPKHGDSAVIATATGGVGGTFGAIYGFQGVLRPELTYGPNSVTATFRSGSLANHITGNNPIAVAFANALDRLRLTSYDTLYGLYGSIDWMDGASLANTLSGFAPRVAGEARALQDEQSRVMLTTISDRLSMLGTDRARGQMSVVGNPEMLMALSAGTVDQAAQQGLGIIPTTRTMGALPPGMSGFIAGGIRTNAAALDGSRAAFRAGQRSWHIGMGLEMAVGDAATLGTAFGYASGYSAQGSVYDRAEAKSSQVAVYGSYRLGDGFYVAGLAAAENSRASLDRHTSTGDAVLDLTGATKASRYSAMAETGVNLGLGNGLMVTPRVAVGYSSYALSGYRETGGAAALQLDDLKVQQLDARIGAKLSGATRIGSWTFVPQLQADLVQNLSGGNDGLTVRFADAPEHAFALPIAGGDSNWAELKGGLKLTRGKLEFGAGLETSLGRTDYRDDRAMADFTIRF